MRVLWFTRKYLDVALDSVTWVAIVRALEAEGVDVVLHAGYRTCRRDMGLGERLHYIWSVKLPLLNAATMIAGGMVAMTRALARRVPTVVLVDPIFVMAAVPFALIRRWRRSGEVCFVVDVRTIPIESGRWTDRLERGAFLLSMRLAGRFLDGATAITEPVAAIVRERSRLSPEVIGVWSSGVDVECFNPDRCGSHRSVTTTFDVWYHGALLASRGLSSAIEAMVDVSVRTGHHVRLHLMGSGPDAAMLKRRVVDLELDDVVVFHDPVAPALVPSRLCLADAGLVPFPDIECWRVSSPLKLLEYLSMNLPVIATRLECCESVVGDAPYVVWSRSASARDLADAIVAAFERRDSLVQDAADARALVCRDFTWQAQARALKSHLVRLVHHTRSARSSDSKEQGIEQ